MDRRTFLKSGGATATGLVATSVSAAASRVTGAEVPPLAPGAQILSVGFSGIAARSDLLRDGVDQFAARLSIATEGQVVLRSADDGDGGDILVGAVPGDEAGALALFTGHPLALGGDDFACWLSVGGGQSFWDGAAERAGVKPFLLAVTDEAPILVTSGKGNREAGADLKAAYGLGSLVARFVTGPASSSDVLRVLHPIDAMMAGLEPDSRLVRSAWEPNGACVPLSVQLSRWQELSAAHREIFVALACVMERELSASLAVQVRHTDGVLASRGMRVDAADQHLIPELKAAASNYFSHELPERDLEARLIWESQQHFANQARVTAHV